MTLIVFISCVSWLIVGFFQIKAGPEQVNVIFRVARLTRQCYIEWYFLSVSRRSLQETRCLMAWKPMKDVWDSLGTYPIAELDCQGLIWDRKGAGLLRESPAWPSISRTIFPMVLLFFSPDALLVTQNQVRAQYRWRCLSVTALQEPTNKMFLFKKHALAINYSITY